MRHHGVQIQKAFGGHLRQLPTPHGKSFGSIPDGHQGVLPTPKAVSCQCQVAVAICCLVLNWSQPYILALLCPPDSIPSMS